MRIVIETAHIHAIAFHVPVAEFCTPSELERTLVIRDLGPDPLAADFSRDEAVTRLMSRGTLEVAEALLDQSTLAGLGNVYKSEVLFACRINPFAAVSQLTRADVERLVDIASKFLRANVAEGSSPAIETYRGLRRTTGRHDPGARLWVYGRAGKPCRRCGAPIQCRKQGPNARSTYWCERCQSEP
jgi:endonuclease-8